jgi:lipopolysaccharide transport system ATP-binding protein
MSDLALRVSHLSKQYKLGKLKERHDTFRDHLMSGIRGLLRTNGKQGPPPAAHTGASVRTPQADTHWALNDVSFEVKQGEVVGLIGRNGAGKSTLLKILSRITLPTVGRIEVFGRVASLLEVGTGFHPELTGRENVFLNGSILGMRKTEIDRKFDEIVAFADIGPFLDTPVKRYSSGMYLRLAFAVAAHLDPEILIVDEVLAVGDIAFREKCLGKMREVGSAGRTVLLVSHDMAAITQLCSRALCLADGRLTLDGNAEQVVTAYLSSVSSGASSWDASSHGHEGEQECWLTSARVLNSVYEPSQVVEFDAGLYIQISYEVRVAIPDLAVASQIIDTRGNIIFTSWDNDATEWHDRTRDPGSYVSTCCVPACLLRPGHYRVSMAIFSSKRVFDRRDSLLSFEVSHVGYALNQSRMGLITPILKWEVSRDRASSCNS